MIIGSLSHIPYGTFAAALWPVAAVGLALTALLIALFYRQEFLTGERLPTVSASPARHHPTLVIKAVLVTVAMMVFFFAGQPVAKVAIVGGALLLFTRRVKAEKVYREIDWPLLLMFAGLFIVVAALEANVLTPEMIAAVGKLDLETTPVLSAITAVLSNLVSNVPAVLVLKPFIAHSSDRQSDRRTACSRRGCHNRVLGLFQGRRAVDDTVDPVRRLVALTTWRRSPQAYTKQRGSAPRSRSKPSITTATHRTVGS